MCYITILGGGREKLSLSSAEAIWLFCQRQRDEYQKEEQMFLIGAQCKEIDGIMLVEGYALSVVWFHWFDFKIQSKSAQSITYSLMDKN